MAEASGIERAARVLREGGLVAFPTETVYGLGADAENVEAVERIFSAFGGPVAAPSANRFSEVSPTTARHVREGLGSDVDLVLDGGPCEVGVESTIVDVTGERPAILRPGGVGREDLERALGRSVAIERKVSVRAPGRLPSHYAPRARVVLVEPDEVLAEAERLRSEGHRVGLLLHPALARARPSDAGQVVTVVPGSMPRYARRLYTLLRELDHRGCEVIVASLPEQEGLGLAVADRLRRAAGPR